MIRLYRINHMRQLLLSVAVIILVSILLFMPRASTHAQDDVPEGPIYVVQEYDTLWDIAVRFNVSVDELLEINDINNPSLLSAGDQLVIPGLGDIQGILTTERVNLGDTLTSLSRSYDISSQSLLRLNRLVSPQEVYAGSYLIIPLSEAPVSFNQRASIHHGQSLFELALLTGTNPWNLMARNQLEGSWAALPGDVLRAPGESDSGPGALPETVLKLEISDLPLVQGQTTIIQLTASDALTLTGFLGDYPLHFFSQTEGQYAALQGIHAMQIPGNYLITLRGELSDGTPIYLAQNIIIQAGNFPLDPPLTVDPATIDPAVTQPENELWASLYTPASSQKMWHGSFNFPAPTDFYDCYTSWFGDRRSYNGSAYIYFHSGLDICTGAGTEIYSAAAGTVVFADLLTVRGNAVMIDHGWGVYTAYMHLSEITVNKGDQVVAGELIGISGGTGRVAGPHLHWEVIVGGIQVEPSDWLVEILP